MAFLESLASGLRGAGSVLSQDVYHNNLQDDRIRQQELARRRDMILQQTIRGVESGSIPREAGQAIFQKFGIPDLPAGLSIQAQIHQAQLEEVNRKRMEDQATEQRMRTIAEQYRQSGPQEIQGDDFELTQSQGMDREQALRRAATEMLLDPNPKIADRGASLQKVFETVDARKAAVEATIEQRKEAERNRHQVALQNAATAQQRATETAMHNRTMEGLTRVAHSIRAASAGSRQYPIVQTSEGIFERRPEGLVKLLDPDKGTPLRPASLTAGDRGDRRDAMGLYEKVEADPQVKLYKTITPKYEQSAAYFAEVQKDPSKQSNAQDLALMKNVVSIVHKSGDTVSNADMGRVDKLPGIDERIVGAVQNVLDGRQLQPKVRADMMRMIGSFYGQLNAQVVGIEDRRRLEASNFGLDPDKAVPKIGKRQSQPQAAPQQNAQPRVIDFNDLPTGRP